LGAGGSGWDARIKRLLDQGYQFLAMRYSPGVLFRGMASGLADGIARGGFGHYAGEGPHAALERELGVLFISHEMPDALGVARFWEPGGDRALLVFDSVLFNRALQLRQAAVLAFAEGGMIFRYPFFVLPLAAADLLCIFTAAADGDRLARLPGAEQEDIRRKIAWIGPPRAAGDPRADWELAAHRALAARGYRAAQPVYGGDCPAADRDASAQSRMRWS
jgi:hypothetical protein